MRAVVQPGGSIRDGEVIEAAQKAGVTLYLTGCRHFFHWGCNFTAGNRPGLRVSLLS